MASCRKWGAFYYFSVVRFPESGCLIVTKRKGGKCRIRDVAKIFSRGTHGFQNPSPLPSPLKSGSYCFVFPSSSAWRQTTLCCMLQALWNKFEQMALKVAWWCDIMGRKACRCRRVRGHPPPGKFWKFGHVLMPCVAYTNPLRSAFCWQFRSVIDCDRRHSESDEDESLSALELELLVELPIYSFWLL